MYHGSVDSPEAETDQRERSHGFRARYRYGRALKGFAAKLSEPQLKKLRADPDVAFISRERRLRATGTVPLALGDSAPLGVRRIEAATAVTAREASSVNVAVIDTGISLGHPDLNAVNGKNCVGAGAAEDDITATIQNTAFNFRIGRHSQFSFATFNGRIDEVAIYDTALPAATIQNHYTTGTG